MSLSIGQVAERTGLSVHALRFYEREGLLIGPIQRTAGGSRVYTEDDVSWLRLCIVLRASGMPIPTLRRYTDLCGQGPGTELDRLALLRAHQQDVTDKIRQLNECLDIVNYKVAVYEDYLETSA